MKKLLLLLLLPFYTFATTYPGTANGTIAYTTGKFSNQCLTVSANGYVSFTTPPPAMSYVNGGTVELWVNYTITTNTKMPISDNNNWYINTDGGNGSLTFTANPLGMKYNAPTQYNDGNWHHIALVLDLYGYMNFYIDGIFQKNVDWGTGNWSITQIGAYASNLASFGFTGQIQDVVVSNYPKYNGNFTPPTVAAPNTAPNQLAVYHLNGDLTDSNVAQSTLMANTVTLTLLGKTTNTLVSAAATLGTSPYTYQWQRSIDGASYSNISGATSLTLNDAGLTAGTTYYYRVNITDNVSATATSQAIRATTIASTDIRYGLIGDSNTLGHGLTDAINQRFDKQITQLLTYHNQGNRSVTVLNMGVSSTTTASWLTSTTIYKIALAGFKHFGITTVMITLGTNDCNSTNNITQATFLSNLTSIVNDLVSNGMTVILNYPGYPNDGRTGASQTLLQSYFVSISGLCNATTILQGDKLAYNIMQANVGVPLNSTYSMWQADGLHYTPIGHLIYGILQFNALGKLLGVIPAVTPGDGSTNF